MSEIFGESIYQYTRQMAIDDGVLIDVSELAMEAGFKVPVAITDNLYNKWIEPDEYSKRVGQCTTGRIWDVLIHLHLACKSSKSDTVFINVVFSSKSGSTTVKMKSVIGPGDNGEPVITVMFPEED